MEQAAAPAPASPAPFGPPSNCYSTVPDSSLTIVAHSFSTSSGSGSLEMEDCVVAPLLY